MPAPSFPCSVCTAAPAAIIVGARGIEGLEAAGICGPCRERLAVLCSRFGSDLSLWRWAPLADFPTEAFELPEGAEAVAQAEEILRRPPGKEGDPG